MDITNISKNGGFIKGEILVSVYEDKIFPMKADKTIIEKLEIYSIFIISIEELKKEIEKTDYSNEEFTEFLLATMYEHSVEQKADSIVEEQLPLAVKMELGVKGVLIAKLLVSKGLKETKNYRKEKYLEKKQSSYAIRENGGF